MYKKDRVRYVNLSGCKLKIELIEGLPPDEIIICTKSGINSFKRGRGSIQNALVNKQISSLDFRHWYINIDNKEIKKDDSKGNSN